MSFRLVAICFNMPAGVVMPASRFPLWFVVALLPMAASQLIRLQQSDPLLWLLCDYAGRLGTIGVLALMPAARSVAFARVPSKLDVGEIAIWIILLVLFDFFVLHLMTSILSYSYPPWHLGSYPYLHGWLYWFDITLGIALVAYSEELLFRRCARVAFGAILGDGWPMMIATAIFFAAYHWWTGIWNVTAVAIDGLLLMIFYRRSGALWPAIVAHYIFDLIASA